MSDIAVKITETHSDVSHSFKVEPGRFQISKGSHDQVVWSCSSSDFTVDFGNNSP